MKAKLLLGALVYLLLIPNASFSQMPNTVDGYLHLTMIETCFWDDSDPEDIVWFYTGDTMNGAVRSNDFLALKHYPVFYDHVYTSKNSYRNFAAEPYFEYEPEFNVPMFDFAFDIDEIRQDVIEQGNYFPDVFEGTPVNSRLESLPNGWLLVQWPEGQRYSDDIVINYASVDYSDETIIFIEGNLDIFGEHVTGNNTIVCNDTIRIIDNITYEGTVYDSTVTIPDDLTATLGLMAVKDILVANTVENGRDNGERWGDGPFDHSRMHCVITASLVALEGSFSYENKNFAFGMTRFDGYWFQNGNGPDRRGTIFLLGSMAEYRRDYISNSNCMGTGYHKHFLYDRRLEELTPPLFDMPLGVWENPEDLSTLPVTHQLEKPYPNPFNSSFNLNMVLAQRDQVKIRLINVLGQEVFAQDFGWMNSGDQRFTINLSDNPAGLYFAEITTANGFKETAKVVFIK